MPRHHVPALVGCHRPSFLVNDRPDHDAGELADTHSGNTVREYLGEALEPTREIVVGLDEKLTQTLQSQLPKGLFRRLDRKAYEIGIDLTEIPYNGQPAHDEDEIRRNKAKSGTTHFHAYATSDASGV